MTPKWRDVSPSSRIFLDQMDSVFDGYVGDHPLKSAFTRMANLRGIIAKVLKNLIGEVYKCWSNSDLLGFCIWKLLVMICFLIFLCSQKLPHKCYFPLGVYGIGWSGGSPPTGSARTMRFLKSLQSKWKPVRMNWNLRRWIFQISSDIVDRCHKTYELLMFCWMLFTTTWAFREGLWF